MDKLRRHLAEKVMGIDLTKEYGFMDNDGCLHAGARWNPPENIEQAFMCLDTFSLEVEIDSNDATGGQKAWRVCILEPDGRMECSPYESLPMAISLACAGATGYEDE